MPGAMRWAFSCYENTRQDTFLLRKNYVGRRLRKMKVNFLFSSSSYDVRTCGSYPCLDLTE